MNQIKIGRFIAECRKKANLTQMQLAEKLGITDKAVSKWERGVAMPDVSIMLELCDILCISVNELLSGEKINMENNNQKNEQLLLDMAKELEKKNKTVWSSMWALMIVSMAALIAGIFIAAFLIPEGVWQLVTILGVCVVFLIPCFYALRLEVSVGAYKCKNCGCEIVPTYKEVMMAMHRGFTRHLMCPKCNKRTWCKKSIEEVNSNISNSAVTYLFVKTSRFFHFKQEVGRCFEAVSKDSELHLFFLLLEAALYLLILTTRGIVLVCSSYAAIVLCFLYSLFQVKCGDRWITVGLGCTMVADFFLVICSPIQRLWGMLFFLVAQIAYSVKLRSSPHPKFFIILRITVIILIEVFAVLILKNAVDLLAMVSVCYYANLLINIVQAFALFKTNRMFPFGLVFFLLCDTVIGLQVASGAYLPIPENSLLYKIIFMNFNLSWFFYLPSQVMIALCSKNDLPS